MQATVMPTVDRDFIQKVIEFNSYNQVIAQYYERYMMERKHSYWDDELKEQVTPMEPLERKFMNLQKKVALETCNRYWTIDKYEKQKIKDVTRQNLCHDRFCSNCKKVKQASRMAKYIPEIEVYNDRLHHLVLTVPNCRGSDIDKTVKLINKSFLHLIRFLRGNLILNGIDFESWQYQGALRSLEVTYKGDDYHPHLHVALIARSGLFEDKHNINRYSFDHRGNFKELKTLFSDQEILIQKIWYLLINGITVNKRNIDSLEEGYSCMATQFKPDDFAELFKYITKDKDEQGNIITYEQWKSLYQGLYRKKQIQGYGCLYQINDLIDVEEFDKMWNEFMMNLRKEEEPQKVTETPEALIKETEYKLISRKQYFKHLRSLYQEE